MALPTLVKSYQFNVNNLIGGQGSVIADNRAFLLAIKNALKGFGSNPWTVRYSCDSVTAGTPGDGVDRWVTGANLVFNSAGSAHSWIVLRQAGISANTELMIECIDASNGGGIRMALNTAASGGTTTASPGLPGGIVLNTPSGVPLTNTNVSLPMRWHIVMSTDGTITHIIMTQNSNVQCFISVNLITNLVSGWTGVPVVAGACGLFSGTVPATSWTLDQGRLGAQTWGACPVATATVGRLLTLGTAIGTTLAVVPLEVNSQLANEISGEWPMAPIWFEIATVGWRGIHGSLVDIYAGSQARPYGDTYPNDTSYQFAQFGGIIVPWNGTIPLL